MWAPGSHPSVREPCRPHVKMRAVLCSRSCSCLALLLLRMLRRMTSSSGSSSSRTRGFSGCLVTSTSIRSRTCSEKGELSQALGRGQREGRGEGEGRAGAHPDLEVPPQRLLLLQLVLLVLPGLDAQLLLSKEAGQALVQRHHGLVPQLLLIVVVVLTVRSALGGVGRGDRGLVSSLS